MNLAIVLLGGVVIVLFSVVMISDYQGMGTSIVESTVPKWARFGSVETHRKYLGYTSLGFSVLWIIIGLIILIK